MGSAAKRPYVRYQVRCNRVVNYSGFGPGAHGLLCTCTTNCTTGGSYRNVDVNDAVSGVAVTARKEEIQQFIEDQIELGEEGLDESDYYLLEVNLEDLESTSGEEQHYWLLQIQAARRDCQLRRNRTQNMNQPGPRERRA